MAKKTPVEITILKIELVLGIWIGAVTFTGSVIAYGKLAGRVDSAAKQAARAGICSMPRPRGCHSSSLILYLGGSGSWTLVLLTLSGALHRLSPDHGDRRGGHAGGGLDAELLFRLGGGGHRLQPGQ